MLAPGGAYPLQLENDLARPGRAARSTDELDPALKIDVSFS